MSLGKPPTTKAPWPPERSNDKLFRYPLAYPIGRKKGENFATIAKDHALEVLDLIRYNFRTTNSDVVNWYLGNYVGCPEPPAGVKNYSFDGAVYDSKKNKGVIFVPRFGEPGSDPTNRLGEKVVENYNKSAKKEPGGACFDVAYKRVSEAVGQLGMAALPAIDNDPANTFDLLWASRIEHAAEWAKAPPDYRGKGAAGAMVWKGMGTLVDSTGIWAGKLKPGAVLQTWEAPKAFDRVRDGKSPGSIGHSFIFLNYIKKGSAITGIAVADQGQGAWSGDPMLRSEFSFWVGANLTPAKP
jgi:hypothetical protein